MKKAEKALAMFLSAAAIIIGSAGMTGRSEKRAMSEALYVSQKPDIGKMLEANDNIGIQKYEDRLQEERDMSEESDMRSGLPVEPVSRRDFVFLLTGKEDNGEHCGRFITREEAAYIVFTYLINEGYEKSPCAGDLSVFSDGIRTAPQYAQAVSELYALSVYHPIGSLLKPKELITRMDAVDLIARAKKSNESGGQKSRLCDLLGIAVLDAALLENMLSCVIGAMLNEQIYAFSDEPDARFSSLALYHAISWGIAPEHLCAFISDQVVVITQAGMSELYSGMFAEGFFTAFDPMAADERVSVLGDSIVFLPDKKQDIAVSAGTAVREPDGFVTVCCTVYALREYFCTAKVVLKQSGGWAGGHSVKSITLSMG